MSLNNPESQEEYDAQQTGLAAEAEANMQAEADAAAEQANIGIFPELTPGQSRLETELRELPSIIQAEALKLLQLTCDIEKNRKIIAELKADSMALVSEIKDAGKPKYSNSDMREAAVKASLKDNPEFCTSVDELARIEYQQRKKQIGLAFFENKFQACRSIAQLRGVKL